MAAQMPINQNQYQQILSRTSALRCQLLAVSKTKPAEDILALYELGQRDFAENYVQELIEKQARLPKDIRWHFIGHLQTNKVRQVLPLVYLIHGVDSEKLLAEIQKTALKIGKTSRCLLQVHLALDEPAKFGFDPEELDELLQRYCSDTSRYGQLRLLGLMGMASNTPDSGQVRREFARLRGLLEQARVRYGCLKDDFRELSMGMSGDYELALAEGSTMVRIGSLLFGPRQYSPEG